MKKNKKKFGILRRIWVLFFYMSSAFCTEEQHLYHEKYSFLGIGKNDLRNIAHNNRGKEIEVSELSCIGTDPIHFVEPTVTKSLDTLSKEYEGETDGESDDDEVTYNINCKKTLTVAPVESTDDRDVITIMQNDAPHAHDSVFVFDDLMNFIFIPHQATYHFNPDFFDENAFRLRAMFLGNGSTFSCDKGGSVPCALVLGYDYATQLDIFKIFIDPDLNDKLRYVRENNGIKAIMSLVDFLKSQPSQCDCEVDSGLVPLQEGHYTGMDNLLFEKGYIHMIKILEAFSIRVAEAADIVAQNRTNPCLRPLFYSKKHYLLAMIAFLNTCYEGVGSEEEKGEMKEPLLDASSILNISMAGINQSKMSEGDRTKQDLSITSLEDSDDEDELTWYRRISQQNREKVRKEKQIEEEEEGKLFDEFSKDLHERMKDSHLVRYDPENGSAYSLPESTRFNVSSVLLNLGRHVGIRTKITRKENK